MYVTILLVSGSGDVVGCGVCLCGVFSSVQRPQQKINHKGCVRKGHPKVFSAHLKEEAVVVCLFQLMTCRHLCSQTK